jgi:ribosome-associated heat shock protein Hsp15
MRARSDCAQLVAQGSIRINRLPTDKAHAKLRIGDILTVPVHGAVRVVRVLLLANRRGPPSQARLLFEEITEPPSGPCAATESSAYRRF